MKRTITPILYTAALLSTPAAAQIVVVGDTTQVAPVELDEVEVRSYRASTLNSHVSPLQTQKITSDELCRAACCNLSESFETNASVDVSYSDAATGARQIKLLGLAGTYVQMLTEQIPNLQGAASPFGLSYIPGPWMESIQVSKGTSSVKNGYDALAGQINVEYKKPQTADPLTVNLFASHMGRLEANADANLKLNDRLATGLLLHYSQEQSAHDANGDGFVDTPLTRQINGINRWYYKRGRLISQTLANVLHETRESGQIGHHAAMTSDPYTIGITTNRGILYSKNGVILRNDKEESVALMASASYHDQESHFGHTAYDVYQRNLYASLIYETTPVEGHKISTGLSYMADRYHERIGTTDASTRFEGLDALPLRRTYNVGGLYGQYTFSPSDKLTLLAGLRGDLHSLHGFLLTPRLHVRFAPWEELLVVRGSVGRGYRTANVLVEGSYLLMSNRRLVFASDLDPLESAWNYGVSATLTLQLAGKPLTLMGEWYDTRFDRQVVVDLEDARSARFYNLDGRSYAKVWQVEATYPFFRGFSLTAAFRHVDTRTTYDDHLLLKPLNARYKGLATATYATRLKRWQFDLTAQLTGPSRLPAPDAADPLWEEESPAYATLNAQVTKNFRRWSIYVGGENLTGYTQQTTIIDAANPFAPDSRFDGTMVWGPVHGAKFYVGLRTNF
jgi:outer membrane receptor protein involved in Fe transport